MNDSVSTGCSMHSRKTTLAIVSSTSVEQLPAAIAMATPVLKRASRINNSPQLAIFGTGLSDARAAAVENVRMLRSIAEAGSNIDVGTGLRVDRVHVIVGVHDLAMLRFAPSERIGEVCRVPGCSDSNGSCDVPPTIEQMGEDNIAAAIECIRRLPAVSAASGGGRGDDFDQLPLKWKDHAQNVRTFDWLRDLWEETRRSRAKASSKAAADPPDPSDPSDPSEHTPFDVLSLAMFAKMVSIATRTTEMGHETLRRIVSTVDGAVGLGLTALFPNENGDAPSVLSFLSAYLVGDAQPWGVSRRGKAAAKKARVVLDRVYAHVGLVLTVLRHSKLAEVVDASGGSGGSGGSGDGGKGGVLLVHGGPTGKTGKLLFGRVPVRAFAANRSLNVHFDRPSSKGGGWERELNAGLREVVDALEGTGTADVDAATEERVRARLGAYAALASKDMAGDTADAALGDRSATAVLAERGGHAHAVTTFPSGVAAHVVRELVLRESVVQVASTTACVAVQTGTSLSCTFCTFCPTTARSLRAPAFAAPEITEEDILSLQRDVDAIGGSIDRPCRPIGMLTGVLGPAVALEGGDGDGRRLHRVCYWRMRDETRDSIVSFFPNEYVSILFGDYATGSRNVRASDQADDDEEGGAGHERTRGKRPLFAADTIFCVSTASVLPGSEGLAYYVPRMERAGLLDADEGELYAAFEKIGDSGQNKEVLSSSLPPSLSRSFRVFRVRESENDLLCGLRVQFAREVVHGTSGEQALFSLVSDNAAREQLLF